MISPRRASPRSCRRLAALLVAASGPLSLACTQDYGARSFGEPEGLPHVTVHDLAQTGDGLLWVSTANGIASFDGWVFEPEPLVIDGTTLRRCRLATDATGGLWAFQLTDATVGARLIDGAWQPLPNAPQRPMKSGVRAAAVATDGGGDHVLLGSPQGELARLDGGQWRGLGKRFDTVMAIAVHGDRFLIAHSDGASTLPIGDPTAMPEAVRGLPPGDVLALCRDETPDAQWLVGPRWLGLLRGDAFELATDQIPPLSPNHFTVAAVADGCGGLFFGEQDSFHHFATTAHALRSRGRPDLGQIGMLHLLRDREGVMWASGSRGVARFLGACLQNGSSKHGLAEDEVSAVLQLRDGRMLLGHSASLTLLSDPPRILRLNDETSLTRIMAMVELPNGRVLCAANELGVLAVDPDTMTYEVIPIPRGDRRNSVQYVALGPDGGVLVVGWQRAWMLRGDALEPFELPGMSFENDYLRFACFDGPDALVVARNSGVLRISPTGSRLLRGTSPDDDDNIYCVSPRPDGSHWAGTGRGVIAAAPGEDTLRPMLFAGERIDRPVYFITDDGIGGTWFGTDAGVIGWDGERLRRVTEQHGLAGHETNRGAGTLDRDGRLWIGLEHGVSVYSPALDRGSEVEPRVWLRPPLIDGEARVAPWDAVESSRSITFRLRSLATRDAELLQHQRWLEGFDADWSAPRALPEREFTYAGLPSGRYRLHVRVTDLRGHRAEVASPWFDVLPPWWRTWWSFALCAVLVAAALAGASSLLTQRRRTVQLRAAVAARTDDLQSEQRRLATLLASIADGVAGIDAQGRIATWNRAAAALTGWSPQLAIGTPWRTVMPGVDVHAPGRDPIEVALGPHDHRWLEFSVAPIEAPDSRDITGVVVAFRDVTLRREQERLMARSERLESLGVLAGGIAHDFNNLLTVVLGNIGLIEISAGAPGTAEAVHDACTQIQQATLRARDLTQQLLTFAKGGAPARRPMRIERLITDCARLALSGANVRAELQLAPGLHATEVDAGQIAQVLHNLVLNARQAMPEGGTVVVRASNVDADGPGVLIEIVDHGVGIDAAQLERIFDPYYSTKPHGSGLGLAIAHSIVARHGGRITVSSSPGHGSTFRVHLPACSGVATDDNADTARTAAARSLHVLCMDDEPGIRRLVQVGLASFGHRVEVVADGSAAVAAFRAAQQGGDAFDLVILDLTVPGGLGGVRTLAELHAIAPGLPAIAASGYSTEPVRGDNEAHGFRASLDKPFDLATLAATIERVMDRDD
ncbi:MAG: ATP-binding protein [Planctomycetota bacterium]